MSQDRYPPGVPCWIDLVVRDLGRVGRFYAGVLGWELVDAAPAGSSLRYVMARRDGRDVAALSEGFAAQAVWSTYVRVASAEATAARARELGGSVVTGPMAAGAAGISAEIADPVGARIRIFEPRAFAGAGLVNAPGSWNWSDLHARDLDTAVAFYGALFGWEADPVDVGAGDTRMWRMPGYGDVLERRDPGIRARHAEHGAPPGFTDAIGWLQEAAPHDAPHWHVTFAVDDTDGLARRAEELGGMVTIAPFDAGPTRVAQLADPEGARFTISHYAPR